MKQIVFSHVGIGRDHKIDQSIKLIRVDERSL